MRKRNFIPTSGVSNVELFYDLIFVYCISVLTSLCHHVHGDFLDLQTWLVYLFSFLVVLQVWFFTTFLMNRYGERSASDYICLFINMFLLYFLASGIQSDWAEASFTFTISWALIVLNLFVHWLIKYFRYDNLDDIDRKIIRRTAGILLTQFVIIVIATFIPSPIATAALSWVGLAFGGLVWANSKVYRCKPGRFAHIVERCSLLTIIAFGETIVAIASYMTGSLSSPLYPVLVFALVVGLFLIYIYERDTMTDHHREDDGMVYMTITGWIILVVGNLTVALEYMLMSNIAFLPKSLMLVGCLVLYLLTSFTLGRYNQPQFRYTLPYALGRVGVCVFIIAVALVTNFDPLVNLVCDTVAIYFALWHEWLLFHGRSQLIEVGRSLGYTEEDAREAGLTFTTREGRRAIAEFAKDAYKRSRESSDR